MAEAHPVGFQWVMEAKKRGAKIIHVDPRFSRTSAVAHLHVPIRAGADIAFVGGLINYVLQNNKYFRDYVVAYTNGPTIIDEDFRDTEDLDGLFSGWDPEHRTYDWETWRYQGDDESRRPAAPAACSGPPSGKSGRRPAARRTAPAARPRTRTRTATPRCSIRAACSRSSSGTSPGTRRTWWPRWPGSPRRSSSRWPRPSRRTPAGTGPPRSCTAWAGPSTPWACSTSAPRRSCRRCWATWAVPGGGILALRGHASIQGSTDIPTLFDLLPGYLPMPFAHHDRHDDLDSYVEAEKIQNGFWANTRDYMVSLLKAYWGDAATADNDFCYDYLPRLTGDHSTYETVKAQMAGLCQGYFLFGQNPAVGSANARMQRMGLANLDWLVVRDLVMIESATFWKNGPEIETGEMRTEDIKTEVFFMPAAAHTEKSGSFTNTQRMLQWHHTAVEPAVTRAATCGSPTTWAAASGRSWPPPTAKAEPADRAGRPGPGMDRPILTTWDYPTEGPQDEPDADAVLAEINGWDADGQPLSSYTQLKSDGSTACGCWIYCGVRAGGVNQAARRKPGREQNWVANEWGWAWPANRRVLYNRASADPDGKPWSERKALVWWDEENAKWTGHDIPDFIADRPPSYRPPAGCHRGRRRSPARPVHHAGRRQGVAVHPGWPGGRPDARALRAAGIAAAQPALRPAAQSGPGDHHDPQDRFQPSGDEPGSAVFPYVTTTYRLTEHHTAGGMSRFLPYLAELQPAFFCEVSPELAAERGLEHMGWATIITARNAIEARVMVTRRMKPLQAGGRPVHQIGLPWHWGPNGLTTGDAANELSHLALDPNVHIQEVKAMAVRHPARPPAARPGAARPDPFLPGAGRHHR